MSAVLAQQDPALRRQGLAALAYRPPMLLALDNLESGLDVDVVLQTLAVRYERFALNYLGFVQLGCILILFRRSSSDGA